MCNFSLEEIKTKIHFCLARLYADDATLFTRNSGIGLCERCLVFRFALYLQREFPNYFVDCDFNSSCAFTHGPTGGCTVERDIHGKVITNADGTKTKRFVDIIVHKRTFEPGTDFICFEFKKWNNCRPAHLEKDRNTLHQLTTEYGYHYGFLVILGQTLEQAQWQVFSRGEAPSGLQPFCSPEQ